jgi:hypothetical protein
MSTRTLALATAVLGLAAGVAPAAADDHFLVIGGGYNPSGNQVSLEKNVLLFRTLLGEVEPDRADACEVYFSDGDDPGRDLQYRIPDDALPRANLLLARVLRQTDALGESYRTHSITDIEGGSNRANLDAWFANQGKALRDGDRLLIYVTAHGGAGPKDDPRNTTLHLWNGEDIRVQQVAKLIDSLPEGVSVVLVMVQCYSGGFADLIFGEGNRKNAAIPRDLCGFFATTFDRPAAGCTPDIDEENYHEYSTYFWEAIRRKTRTGNPITRDPDLDGDGRVSFAEAHAYVLLESVTVDIPVKTSDAYLHAYSKADGPGLLSAGSPYDRLVAAANPVDRAVLEGLSAELGLTEPDRVAEARRKADAAQQAKNRAGRDRRNLGRRLNESANPIRDALFARWPELKNRWNPQVTELLTREADAVVRAIEGHRSYAAFEKARRELADLETAQLDQDRIWAKCQRLIHTLENVALAANLEKVAVPATVKRYHKLLACESGALGTGHAIAGTTAGPGEGADGG